MGVVIVRVQASMAALVLAAGCGRQGGADAEVELKAERATHEVGRTRLGQKGGAPYRSLASVDRDSDTDGGEQEASAQDAMPRKGLEDAKKLLSALEAKVEAREASLSTWEAELKERQRRLSEAWKALGSPPKLSANPPLREIEARLARGRVQRPSNADPLTQEEASPDLTAIKMKIEALDWAEGKLRAWDELLKEDEDRCIAAARALPRADESPARPVQPVRHSVEGDGSSLVTPLPNGQRDYRRLVSSGVLGQQMPNSQRIPRGMSFPCIFAQTVNAGKLTNGSKFYLLLASDSEISSGGFGPTHELVDYPKGTYFEAVVVDVKEDVQGLRAGKGGAVFRIERIVIPRTDRQGRASELCVDVAATMGKEAPSSLLYDNEAARSRYAGVAANALQLLDHGTGYFNGQASVEMTMRAWEHFVSRPGEKARSCFLFGTVAKETPCKVDLLLDSWF